MPPTGPGAVLWDVDGTLVDTAELHFRAWADLCREFHRPFTRADFAATFGKRNPEIIHQLFGPAYPEVEADRLARRKEELYRGAARHGVEFLPGARALLEGLDRAGWLQAIGSSAPRQNLDLILDLTHSRHFFAAVVCQEDTQRGKPDPQVFQAAAERLATPPPRCVVMEDAVAGVQAARAGGMKCIAVDFVGHHGDAALRAAGADLVVPSLLDVSPETVHRLVYG